MNRAKEAATGASTSSNNPKRGSNPKRWIWNALQMIAHPHLGRRFPASVSFCRDSSSFLFHPLLFLSFTSFLYYVTRQVLILDAKEHYWNSQRLAGLCYVQHLLGDLCSVKADQRCPPLRCGSDACAMYANMLSKLHRNHRTNSRRSSSVVTRQNMKSTDQGRACS